MALASILSSRRHRCAGRVWRGEGGAIARRRFVALWLTSRGVSGARSAEEGGEEGQSTNDLLWQAARVRLAECDPGQHLAEAVEGVETILHDVEKQCGPVKRFVVMA